MKSPSTKFLQPKASKTPSDFSTLPSVNSQTTLIPTLSLNSQSALSFCLQISKTVNHLKQTHARILRISAGPQQPHQFLLSLTLRVLRFPDHLSYARNVFDQIPHCQNQFIWTSLVRSHSLHGHFSHSLSIYAKMHRNDVPPTAFTFSAVLKGCARLPAMKEGRQISDHVVKSGYAGDKIVQTALLDMYVKCGAVEDARKVFNEMVDRDVVSWTAMISGYAKVGLMEDARALFDRMLERNVVSWTAMVAGYANSGNIGAAREVFDVMPERNAVSWTAMIAGYGKCGDVENARHIFDEVPVQDPTSWAAMIACYSQNGFSKEAIDMYKDMRNANLEGNDVAMAGVISACTQLGDAGIANSVTEHMEERCSELSLAVANALIHMHSKCGCIDRAQPIFEKMRHRDIISYTALITGLADHGLAEKALECFERMQEEGITPNKITFVGVLNACSYKGLVDEGCKYFKLMTQKFRITPLTEHFACMVDLLGRAGRLEEALTLIESMDSAPDAGTWGALLGASGVHCNAKLGEIAAQHLFKIEPENTGNYVLLSNIYASLHRWDEAERVRKLMWERGLMKMLVEKQMKEKAIESCTRESVMKLTEGVLRYRAGRWLEIRQFAFASYSYCTCVDLKLAKLNIEQVGGTWKVLYAPLLSMEISIHMTELTEKRLQATSKQKLSWCVVRVELYLEEVVRLAEEEKVRLRRHVWDETVVWEEVHIVTVLSGICPP
ncbi:hypothetical protein ACLOJK_025438 [Asimina triloba]